MACTEWVDHRLCALITEHLIWRPFVAERNYQRLEEDRWADDGGQTFGASE